MKKKLIVIFGSIIAAAVVVCGAFFITKFIDETLAETPSSDAEFLISKHVWQKFGEESVVWTFEADGVCQITTNSTEYFDCEWGIDGDVLKIKTAWLYDLEDSFTFTLDRGGKTETTLTVTSASDGKVSQFLPRDAE
ncbi:hypothetical protein IJF86_03175 [Candidatus Saccharibacteria bacterium]|nr:hypothetical protein [Candidatus Saccharibacteria bacterium]